MEGVHPGGVGKILKYMGGGRGGCPVGMGGSHYMEKESTKLGIRWEGLLPCSPHYGKA